jgi:hypothetical protein
VHAIKPTAFTDCKIQCDTNYNYKNIDVAFLQELYTTFAHGNGRKRSAVIVNNNTDAVAMKQVSDEDATLIEISCKGLKFYGASLYFAIDRDIERHWKS